MDELKNKLISIENKLGGTEQAPEVEDKLGWHLDYIESLIDSGSGGGTKLYKHDILFKGAGYSMSHLIIINTNKNKIMGTDIVSNTIQNAFIMYNDNASTPIINIRFNGPSNLITFVPTNGFGYYFAFASTSGSSVYIVESNHSNVTEIEDTVTEL
jgi:hypothetical protein